MWHHKQIWWRSNRRKDRRSNFVLGFQQKRTAEPNMSGHCTNRNQWLREQTSGVNWAPRIPQDGYSKTRVFVFEQKKNHVSSRPKKGVVYHNVWGEARLEIPSAFFRIAIENGPVENSGRFPSYEMVMFYSDVRINQRVDQTSVLQWISEHLLTNYLYGKVNDKQSH